MDEQGAGLNVLDYRKLFAWTHLFRAFRIAADIRKTFLAALGLLLIAAGHWTFSFIPLQSEGVQTNQNFLQPWHAIINAEQLRSLGQDLVKTPSALAGMQTNWQYVLKPLSVFTEPSRTLLNSQSTLSEVAWAWTQLFWALLVWALFGGAITRMTAVEFAQEERINIRQALRFSRGKLISYIAAPIIPIAGIGLFWLLGWLMGLVGRTSVVGEVFVGITYIVPLVFGLIMALVLLGVAVGWPLMYAAISTEGSDAFDGFSRSYSYVFGRAWQYLWYAVVALLYGTIVISFVIVMGALLVYLTTWSLAFQLEAESAILPSQIWLNLLTLLIAGFVYSYFWTSSTIVYFLLRRADDATELDEVYLSEEEAEDDLLPIVGVAASAQPVIERPVDGGESTQLHP